MPLLEAFGKIVSVFLLTLVTLLMGGALCIFVIRLWGSLMVDLGAL